jgi:hypothetical protein
MKALVDVALFVLGTSLSIRLIAALFRPLDVWYTIGTAYPRAIRGLLGWGGLTAALLWALPGHARGALLWGLAAYVLFYLGLYVARDLLLRRPRAGARP